MSLGNVFVLLDSHAAPRALWSEVEQQKPMQIAADLNKPFAKVTIGNLRWSKPNSSMVKMKSLQNAFI